MKQKLRLSKLKLKKVQIFWLLFLLFIILGIGFFSYFEIMKTPDSARNKSIKNNLVLISKILNNNLKKTGVLPDSFNEVKILLQETNFKEKPPNFYSWYDPWGRELLYIQITYDQNHAFIIYTLGSDFMIGGKETAYDFFESNITDLRKIKNEIIKHQKGLES